MSQPESPAPPTEGWGLPQNSAKVHYFKAAKSLCSRWAWTAKGTLRQGEDNSPDNCRSCTSRLMRSRHICHARGCDKPVPPRLLCCLKHWRMVPKPLQDEVWLHYKPGQESGRSPVTAEYLAAADAAIQAVADKEANGIRTA